MKRSKAAGATGTIGQKELRVAWEAVMADHRSAATRKIHGDIAKSIDAGVKVDPGVYSVTRVYRSGEIQSECAARL